VGPAAAAAAAPAAGPGQALAGPALEGGVDFCFVWISITTSPLERLNTERDPDSHLAKVWLEDGWGDRCRWPGQIPVLLALPYNRNMEPRLLQLMFRWPPRPSACHRRRAMHVAAAGPEPSGLVWRSGVKAMECSNTGFELKLALYDKPFNNSMDAKKTKVSGRTVLAMIRNILVHDYLKPEHEFILWMDAGASPAPARR
jgi:hypothetical protein